MRDVTSKVFETAQAAVADVLDGASLAVGGFGLCGIPSSLIVALLGAWVRNTPGGVLWSRVDRCDT
jgi:acyl CoA:acetate/3-ketoacid CoA transferase alpha subunit